jgi:hypothetical protein
MQIFFIRLFLFILLPILIPLVQIQFDRAANTHERKIELFLIYLFGLGVAGSGIGGFFSHFFLSDAVAESIGWSAGSPFQLEVAFANLAIGTLGLIATARRDGFREAAVIAATIFSVGASVVHFMDIIASGNLAPGNTLQNINNLVRPALLILFLTASRRAERSPESESNTPGFEAWRIPQLQVIGWVTFVVSIGFGVGYALDQVVLGSIIGVLVSGLLVGWTIRRVSTMQII